MKRGLEPVAGDREDDGDMPGRRPGQSGQALDVSVWPGGLDPVRKLLDRESVLALGKEPSAENRAVRLETDLTEAEVAGSAFVRNALILFGEIGGEETVWTTNDGRLSLSQRASQPDHARPHATARPPAPLQPDFPLLLVRCYVRRTRGRSGRGGGIRCRRGPRCDRARLAPCQGGSPKARAGGSGEATAARGIVIGDGRRAR